MIEAKSSVDKEKKTAKKKFVFCRIQFTESTGEMLLSKLHQLGISPIMLLEEEGRAARKKNSGKSSLMNQKVSTIYLFSLQWHM